MNRREHPGGGLRARRGQNSLELIILLGFLVVVFLGFFFTIQGRIREQQGLRQEALYGQLADLVEKELLLAEKVHPGYMRSFTLPPALDNEQYEVTIEGGDTLVVRGLDSGKEHIRFLSIADIEDETGSADFSLLVDPADPAVMLERTNYELIVRKDCVAQGKGIESCPTTFT